MKLDPVSIEEAARYMGVRGVPDEAVCGLLTRADEMVRNSLSPKYVYRETSVDITESGVKLECMNVPLTGKNIASHLSGCTKAVLLAATLSSEADKLIRQYSVRDMAFSLALDCVCSAAVEQVCEKAEEEIFFAIDAPYRTWRFSPGYGDLPLELQSDVLTALNAQRRIGLTATENSLLIPSKSVTAVIGISDLPLRKGGSGCGVCNMKDRCAFRKSGRSCRG
ncbi:MAG: Vitamin B12 dependent methionine synthase, activation domain [Firmicutes bacterium ADurb.BinA205]|nr:MAG: Vitamin B12 dependent methionine synthase, activation domain [Firmicutes bacterium ADurb.BinA205]